MLRKQSQWLQDQQRPIIKYGATLTKVYCKLQCELEILTLKFSNHSQNWPWQNKEMFSKNWILLMLSRTLSIEKQGRKVSKVMSFECIDT